MQREPVRQHVHRRDAFLTELRDYQERAIQMLREHIKDRPLLCLPTGAGKTSVAAEIIRRATERGKRSIFLVHRLELVGQAVDRLAQFGIDAGQILAGVKPQLELPVQVANIPTLIRREHWPADVAIVDECAHAVSSSWSKIIDRYKDAFLIGLTATPIRLDGRGLGDIFGCIVEPVTTRELIDRGFLVEPVVYAPPIDLRGVKVVAGEYSTPQLAERMQKLVGSLTKTWTERAQGMRTVAFAVNVTHSMMIVDAFRALGCRAAHLDYSMPRDERTQILAGLRAGTLDLVSNCQLLSEGWDLPALQCAILARPTKSLALFRQMVGRVMRPPGPVIVLDHAGNHHEHGVVTDPIEWSLDFKKKKASVGDPIRTCLKCYAVIPSSADVCPECGAPCVRKSQAEPAVENPGELVPFVSMKIRAKKAEKDAEYRRLVRYASDKRLKLGWARHQYKEMFDEWPRRNAIEQAEYKCSGHVWELSQYIGWRCARCCVARSKVQAS